MEVKVKSNMTSQLFDSDLDPKTLIFKFDLDIVKIHLYTHNKVPICGGSKVMA